MSTADLYRNEVERITEIIKEEYEPDKVILFGTNQVMINMLIVKETEMRSYERGTVVSNLINDRKLPFNPFVFTPDELTPETRLGPMLYKEVLEEGEVLYTRED
ncbi:MAG: hypothetical protein AWU54_626 [Candidatus Frackibacter sp. T328-2]|nr:MAG: hypothetical protein AWU54_626 [Candidatus Frackibacter sp. T328-2]